LFKNVKGYDLPVVGNLCARRDLIAKSVGVEQHELTSKYVEAHNKPIPCKVVRSGPVKEFILGDVDILAALPVLTHHEKDAAPYICSGVSIYKDPKTGARGESIHRHQVKGKNRLSICIASRPLSDYYANAEARDEPFEIAVAIGLVPSLLMSSVTNVPEGFDKFGIAGGLKGSPVELVKCETIDVEVPAQAEIVLEGKILPKVREVDGPFGESYGAYTTVESPVIEVKTITHRHAPIYHGLLATSTDAFNLGAIPSEALLLETIRSAVPTVKSVHVHSPLHAVISVSNPKEGDARLALLLALAKGVKHAVAVDDDINIYDHRDVDWAISTRVQADQDLIIIPSLPGSTIDPSAAGFEGRALTAKVGIDATKPIDAPPMKFEKMKVPGEGTIRLEEYMEKR
jgi:2,5-furandicarboxylate decarboxylase 1